MPKAEDILDGKVKDLSIKEVSAMYSLTVSLCYELKDRSEKKVKGWDAMADKFFRYMMDNFPTELVVMGAKHLPIMTCLWTHLRWNRLTSSTSVLASMFCLLWRIKTSTIARTGLSQQCPSTLFVKHFSKVFIKGPWFYLECFTNWLTGV
jgi:hypothetical protein